MPEKELSDDLELLSRFARPRKAEVQRHQHLALYRQAPLWLLISQGMAICAAALFWNQIQHPFLLNWLCSISIFTLLPGFLLFKAHHTDHSLISPAARHRLFLATLTLVAAHWGACSVWLLQSNLPGSHITLLLTVLLITGLPLLRHSFAALLLLSLSILAPLAAGLLYSSGSWLSALPILGLAASVLFSAWWNHREAQKSVATDLEHQSLILYLDNARQVAEQLNQQLDQEVRQREFVERELLQTQRDLEDRIRSRTRELSEANDLLSQQVELRKSISAALVKSQTRLSQAIEASQLALWDWDLATGHVYQSNFNEVFGPRELSSEEFIENMRRRIHPDDYQRIRRALKTYLRAGSERYAVQYRIQTNDGSWMWVEDCGKAVVIDQDGTVRRMLGTRRDISYEKRQDEQLRMAKSVYDNTSEGVFVLDTDFCFVSINPAFTRITGYREEEVLGRPIGDVSNISEKEEVFAEARDALARAGVFKAELCERRRNGEEFPGWLQINVIRNSAGELTHYAGLFSDLTERKQTDEKLQQLLSYDGLTGLANRVLFRSRLHDAVNRARRHLAGFTLISINIDRFRQINETLGHDVGDLLLQQTAQRLTDRIPDADTIARLGNDEFCVLLQSSNRSRIAALASQILTDLSTPVFINNTEVVTTASLGITLIPMSARDIQSALQQANVAVRHAKYLGGNSYEFYSSSLKPQSRQHLRLETELRKALHSDALEVFYQPKLHLASGRIESVEALVRWHHPIRGAIPPTEFVPIAEESGLISELGERVLQTACHQAQAWQDQGLGRIKVAVNLSARQLRQSSLAFSIRAALHSSKLDPGLLDLELTESALMENITRSLNILSKLRDMGISLTIDDFGTGYSSLSYLKEFPVDTIKIDQTFIRDILNNPDDAAITKAIIVLGQSLKMEVVAEGVESREQLEFLKRRGCDIVQGYFVAAPQNTADVTELLRSQQNQAILAVRSMKSGSL